LRFWNVARELYSGRFLDQETVADSVLGRIFAWSLLNRPLLLILLLFA